MTTSRHLSGPLRRRRAASVADRVMSAGLATAACVGIVGVIGVRSVEQSAAADGAAQQVAMTPVVSSAGLTLQQLDAYAGQLQSEAARLDAYRAKLVTLASKVDSSHRAAVAAPAPVARPKPVAKPAPKPAPKAAPKPARRPAAKPQSHTKGS